MEHAFVFGGNWHINYVGAINIHFSMLHEGRFLQYSGTSL